MRDLKEVIFIHIPRTAGTSIYTNLNDLEKSHRHFFARKFISIRQDWNQCFKFSFVRNPWERAVSLYCHQTKCSKPFKEWLLEIVESNGHPKLNKQKWELRDKLRGTGGSGVPWKCQTDWLIDNSGKLCMDFIGRYENLNNDIKKLSEIIGHNIVLPHLNKTNHSEYQTYYDAESKDIVSIWHKKDIESFGYKFKSPVKFL